MLNEVVSGGCSPSAGFTGNPVRPRFGVQVVQLPVRSRSEAGRGRPVSACLRARLGLSL